MDWALGNNGSQLFDHWAENGVPTGMLMPGGRGAARGLLHVSFPISHTGRG